MDSSSLLLAYVGPDTFLPLTSALAAVSGVVLMGGRRGLLVWRGLVRRIVPGVRRSALHTRQLRVRVGDAQETGATARR